MREAARVLSAIQDLKFGSKMLLGIAKSSCHRAKWKTPIHVITAFTFYIYYVIRDSIVFGIHNHNINRR